MKIEGTYTFDAPREVVWSLLLDPDVLIKGMAGCKKMEYMGDGAYEGTLAIPVGPIQGLFSGTVLLSDINAPKRLTLTLHGEGEPGSINGHGTMRLSDEGESCTVYYTGEAEIDGRLASINRPLLETSARALVRQSLDALAKSLHPEKNISKKEIRPIPSRQTETAISGTALLLFLLAIIFSIVRLSSKTRRRRHAHEVADILEARGVTC